MQPTLRNAILYGARWYENYKVFGMAALAYADIGELRQAWKCLCQVIDWRDRVKTLSKMELIPHT